MRDIGILFPGGINCSISLCLVLLSWTCGFSGAGAADLVQLTSTSNSFMSMVAGFTARIQCALYRCGALSPTLIWSKDDVILFNGTEFMPTSGIEPSKIILQRSIAPEGTNECVTEEYTLLLKNLSSRDAGEYRCQLMDPMGQQLDFRLDVLESGLKAGFHENFTFDYTECCVEKGLSPLCRAMCKPRDMHLDFFDPTSCATDDYKHFLSCATDEGKRDYIPCCRQKSVPAFCHDFCSNNFQMLTRSHRLCLYYLPEIFDCFNKRHISSSPPQVPSGLRIISNNRISSASKLCWVSTDIQTSKEEQVGYSIHVKELLPDSAVMGFGLKEQWVSNEVRRARRKRQQQLRGETFLVAHGITGDTQFIKLNPRLIEKIPISNELCASWKTLMLRSTTRYVVYVQASNDFGTSEPSQPLFISTTKLDT